MENEKIKPGRAKSPDEYEEYHKAYKKEYNKLPDVKAKKKAWYLKKRAEKKITKVSEIIGIGG